MKHFSKLNERFAYAGQFSLENLLPGLRGQSIGSNLTMDLSGATLTLPTSQALTSPALTTPSIGVATGTSLAVTSGVGIVANSIIYPQYEYITSPTFAAATFANGSSYPIYTFPNDGTTWKAVFASLRFTTAASSAATCQVFFDASATAPGGGTAQFATMLLNGSANTVVNAATPVSTTSSAGMAISLAAAGAATTGLVGLVVTVAIQRLS